MSNLQDSLKNIRRDYATLGIDDSQVPENPKLMMENWLSEAIESGINEPNAFALATSGEKFPDCRIVLLRTLEEEGFSFFTNYTSKKAVDMDKRPNVTANFFWLELHRQVRIKGKVQKVSVEESDAYFESRPRNSQLGAWASNQSKKLKDRKELEDQLKLFDDKYKGKPVPRPEFWGGYLIRPSYYEFWQGRPNRLHDRIVFELEEGIWKKYRLAP